MTHKVAVPNKVFGNVVSPALYDIARIEYPPDFAGQILQNIISDRALSDTEDRPCIIDMGAGTGRLGEAILDLKNSEPPGHLNGREKYPDCDVIFVEPNSKSVKHLKEKLTQNPNPHVLGIIEASAEDDIAEKIGQLLGGRRANAIVMGDSAHWIKAERALPRLRELLVPEGKIAVFSRFWGQGSDLTLEADRLLRGQCGRTYRKSPARLVRNLENLKLRHGQHLINEMENDATSYVRIHEYSKEELLTYFASCSFSAAAVLHNKDKFRENVIEKLWKYAEKHDGLNPDKKLLTSDGKLKVPYQVNATYGEPRIISRHTDRMPRFQRMDKMAGLNSHAGKVWTSRRKLREPTEITR